MKAIPLLLAAATLPASGQIWADFTVDDDGDDKRFTVVLDYIGAQRSVANFIGLATGTRKWVDADTGRTMIGKPFYNGQIIYRARHDALSPPVESGIWLGSQSGEDTGEINDGAGYLFQDELGLASSPASYVFLEKSRDPDTGDYLPNTNGSRLLITSNSNQQAFPDLVPIGFVPRLTPIFEAGQQNETAWLNILGMATVLTDTEEKPLFDLTITNVQIWRAGTQAILFNELRPEWNLPEVGAIRPFIAREGGTHYLRFSDSPDAWGIYQSSFDLKAWSSSTSFFQGPDTPLGIDLTDSIASSPRHFFRGSAIHYPTSPATDLSLADSSLRVAFTSFNRENLSLQFDFNSTASGGTWRPLGSPSPAGNLTLVEFEAVSPYVNELILSGDHNLPNFFFRIIHDIDPTTGAPVSASRLEGFEWTLEEIGPGIFRRQTVPGSEFPYLNSSAQWEHLP